MIRRVIRRGPTATRARRAILLFALSLAGWMNVRTIPFGGHKLSAQKIDLPAAPHLDGTVRVDELEAASRTLLDRAEQLVMQKRGAEAIEIWQRLIDSDGDRLTLSREDRNRPADHLTYVPLRDFLHQRIWLLHISNSQATRDYRAALDQQVQRWLKPTDARNDEAILRRVYEQAFLSQETGECLWRLSQMAMERGEYSRARRYLQQLSSEVNLVSAQLTATSETTQSLPIVISQRYELADIAARLVIVSILQGDRTRAEKELAAFRQQYPKARGQLGGQTDLWCDLLDGLWQESRGWRQHQPVSDWPTYGGRPDRTRVPLGEVDLAMRASWRVTLPRVAMDGSLSPSSSSPPSPASRYSSLETDGSSRKDSIFPYHPIVLDGRVYLSSPLGVHGWHLSSGKPIVAAAGSEHEAGLLYRSELPANANPERTNVTLEKPELMARNSESSLSARISGTPAFLLTADSGALVTKTGLPWFLSGDRFSGRGRAAAANQLVALDLTAEGRSLWLHDGERISASEESDSPGSIILSTWDGPPVIHQGRLYQGFRQSDGVQTRLFVVCLDLMSGRMLWKSSVVSADFSRIRARRQWTNNLLTLHENTLYYNTNVGVVAALETDRGQVRWITRYARRLTDSAADARPLSGRGLNPCLIHHDRVLVAPTDSHQIMALDVATGRVIWSTVAEETADINQLIGVGAGRLIAAGRCLRWIDVETGGSRGQFPAVASEQPLAGSNALHSAGQAILVDQHVWWPTAEQIYVFEQQTMRHAHGWQPELVRRIDLRARQVTGGNLLIADGVLLIAGPDTLTAFRRPEN
ncbi:MAG: PQQ-binding-like beta-propeller repeat protein [Planctomycetota bacterium]